MKDRGKTLEKIRQTACALVDYLDSRQTDADIDLATLNSYTKKIRDLGTGLVDREHPIDYNFPS